MLASPCANDFNEALLNNEEDGWFSFFIQYYMKITMLINEQLRACVKKIIHSTNLTSQVRGFWVDKGLDVTLASILQWEGYRRPVVLSQFFNTSHVLKVNEDEKLPNEMVQKLPVQEV